MNELKHLGIIMDGNGRWAKRRSLMRSKGHEAGAQKVQMLCEFCLSAGIQKLSLYAFSTENWQRPKTEVDFLLSLLSDFLRQKREIFIKNEIKFKAIGELCVFSCELKEQILNLVRQTQDFNKLEFNLAINYGGRDEILRAFSKIALELSKTAKSPDELAKKLASLSQDEFATALDEADDIDLLIRTGGESRISNFMLWQASYAELAFSQTLFPDFSKSELESIITRYKQRHRRFGGL